MKKLLLLLALAACDSADRQSAGGVVNSVARFRGADLASTPAAVDSLKATPCTAEGCATKDACLAAGEPLATGIRLKGEVERMIPLVEQKKIAPDSVEALTLPSRLEQAEVLIKKGFDALPACDESVVSLKRRYRL